MKEDDSGSGLIGLEDFLKEQESTSTDGDLLTDDGQANQLRRNLFVFLVFLVAIVAWLVWLNRELSQEKKEDADDDNNDDVDSKE